ncbi:MAG: MotA/TolQ/ExbB proton channel family protein [Candidatus Alcyoniella australis]|nr:MotA/TolQ/ExbB proton channel family protein [Candidatus Alcyoniella australis]
MGYPIGLRRTQLVEHHRNEDQMTKTRMIIIILAVIMAAGLATAQVEITPSPADVAAEAIDETQTEAQTVAEGAGDQTQAEPIPTAEPSPAVAEPTPGELGMTGRNGIERRLISVSMAGARALLYVLFLMSFLSVFVTIEKYVQYRRENPLGPGFRAKLVGLLQAGDVKSALAAVTDVRGVNAALIREGLQNFDEGPGTIEEVIEGRLILERSRLERRLIILGTIGNNAPFVGLLGTVMGIIKAFHDLSIATSQGPQTVMAGISEALIATAVGLFVAIPAVIVYNWLKGRARLLLDEAEANAKIVLAYAKRAHGK